MNNPRRPKVAITGVAGFIGSNLADRLLAEGYEVLGIDNLAYGVREQVPDGVEFIKMDVRHPEIGKLLEGADVLYHLAAKNCISDCQLDPVETSDINVFGTVNIFEGARRAGVKKIIYAESSAVYEGTRQLPTPESAVSAESFYAISKVCGMMFADAYRRFFGMNMTALRYFCVYGPRQDYRRTIPPLMSAFIIKLLKGEQPTIYGTGEKRRDFVYVDDINDFHLLAMRDPRTDGRVFNLGSGVNYSVREIFDMVRELLGSPIEPSYANDLPGEAQANLADISEAKSLGWAPRVPLKVGLQQSIDFIRANLF